MSEKCEPKLVLTEAILDLPGFGGPSIRRRLYAGWLRKSKFDLPVAFAVTDEHYDGSVEWIYVEAPFRRLGLGTELLYAVTAKYPKIELGAVFDDEQALYDNFDRSQKPFTSWQYLDTTVQIATEDEDYPLVVLKTELPWTTDGRPKVCDHYYVWDKSMEYVRPMFVAVPCGKFVDGLWIYDWETPPEKRQELVSRVNSQLVVQQTP